MAKRFSLPKTSIETRRLYGLLEEELLSWPQVSSRPMFGMLALYRGKSIFAALPRSRGAGTESSMLLKLPGVRHERLRSGSGPGAGWVTFELNSDDDIREALRWLDRAYRQAKDRSRT